MKVSWLHEYLLKMRYMSFKRTRWSLFLCHNWKIALFWMNSLLN